MEFNTLVKTKLFPILQKHGYIKLEESKNYISFLSAALKINVIYNDRENSNLIQLGHPAVFLYPLNDEAVQAVFHSDLPVERVSSETFVNNLCTLFQQKEGAEILNGHMKELSSFIDQQSHDYTAALLKRQALAAASRAWDRKDYGEFIKCLDKLGLDQVPKSLQLKYKMAKDRL